MRAVQRPGTGDLEIRYDLADVDSSNLAVAVNVTTNDGASWFAPAASNLTGAVGSTPVTPGSDCVIVWQGWHELPAQIFSSVKVKVIASDAAEVAWYKMDDNAANRILVDSSVSAYNATNNVQNTANRTTTGKLGGALYYTDTEHAASQCPAVTGALSGRSWTIAYWAQRASTLSHAAYWMMQRNNGDPYGGFCYINSTTGLRWHAGPALGEIRTSISPFEFAAGTWVHFTFVRSGTDWKMYRNGVLMITGIGDDTNTCSAFNLGIVGNDIATIIATNTRTLDDFRIYGAPLMADDVAYLYNSGNGRDTPLVMEGGFGVSPTTVYDLSRYYMSAVGFPVVPIGDTNAVTIASDNSGDGGTSVKLGGVGLIDDGEMAGIEWSATGSGVLAFDWKVSSEEDYDWLHFYEAGTGETNQISGTGAGWTRAFFTITGSPSAVHTFRWEYVKDPVGDYVGDDCGWIDAISWTPFYALAVNDGIGDGE